MKGLGILILVVVFLWLIWPTIARWLKRKAIEKAEDYMRASMGMPPREKKTKSYFKSRKEGNANKRKYEGSGRSANYSQEPIIPKEYAEDVEFTETIDYSEKEYQKTSEGTQTYHESQISDAEYTEIKTTNNK